MSVVLTTGRYHRAAKQTPLLQRGEHLVITIPGCDASGGDLFGSLELRPQPGGGNFAWQERRADVLPRVLVDLAAKKPAAVGALFAEHLGARNQGGIAHQQAAAFPGNDVFGFMEAEGAEFTDSAQRTALVTRHYALGGILDHLEIVAPGNRKDA